jgi:hypothetical protein
VLAAAYEDPTLRRHVSHAELSELWVKTIDFIKLVAQPSSALTIDYKLLQAIQPKMGLYWPNEMDTRTNTSFSSHTSSGGYHPIPPTPMQMAHALPHPSPSPVSNMTHGAFSAPQPTGWDHRGPPAYHDHTR